MKWFIPVLAVLAAAGTVARSPAPRAEHSAFTTGRSLGGILEYTHKGNGLQVLLVPNDVAPVVTVGIIYRVGSRNEAVGYTGSTHMLEHMLFKGTTRHHKSKGTQIAALLSAQGASFNATTSMDRTNYFEQLPASGLDLALDIESDRMRNSLIADSDRASEMTVVRNELERGDNNPERVLELNLMAVVFREHPYHHPTIGWRSDVEGVPTSRLKQFYDDFYHPDNATLVIVGAFDPAATLAKVDKFFGPIPAKGTFPEVYTVEPPQQGERRLIVRRPGRVGLISMKWRGVRALDPDFQPLNVLGNIMAGGVNSRLRRALVDTGKMVSVDAGPYETRDPSIFEVSGTLAKGVKHEEVEAIVRAEVRKVAEGGVSPQELAVAKRQLSTDAIYSRDSGMAIYQALVRAVGVGDWTKYTRVLADIGAVTPAQVQAAARTHLVDDGLSVGWYVPESGAGAAATAKPAGAGARPADEFFQAPEPGVAAGAAPWGGAAGGTRYAQRVERLAPKGGGVYLALENRGNPTVTIAGRLRVGPAVGGEDPVLPAIALAMLMKGTAKRTKAVLGDDLEGRGISLSYALDPSAPEDGVISGRCLKEDWPVLQAALVETLREPAFDESELALVRKELEAAYQREADATFDMSRILATRKIFPAGHPSRMLLPDEKIKLLGGVTRERLLAFHKRYYGAQTLVVSVVGDIDRKAVVKSLAAGFSGWKAPEVARVAAPAAPAPAPARETLEMKKANADLYAARSTGLTVGSPDRIAVQLSNNVLGGSGLSSRLGNEVRDRLGLTYGIYSRSTAGTQPGYWFYTVTIAPENREKAETAARGEIEKYLAEGPTEKEAEAARTEFVGSYQVGLATNAGLAAELARAEGFGLGVDYLDRYPELVRAVSRERMHEVAKRYFSASDLATAVVGKDAK